MSNAPVIDTTADAVTDPQPPPVKPSAPPPAVQQLTVADIVARIHAVLMSDDGYSLTRDQVNRIEQLGQVQFSNMTWVTGKSAPGSEPGTYNDAFHVLAMYQGSSNEQVADHMQGDVRAYLIPRTMVSPGAKEYRRYTFNLLMAKTTTHRMTLDQFIETVAYEELTVATDTGIVEEDEEEEVES